LRVPATILLVAVLAACPRQAPPASVPEPAVPLPDAATAPLPLSVRVTPDPEALRAIVAAARRDSRVRDDLRHLTDVIGPRLTGSSAMRRANEWALAKLREYGADTAWLEAYQFGRTWERGPLALTMTAPHYRQIVGASAAWAPGTPGAVSGDVVLVDARTPDEFARRFRGRLAGQWVIVTEPVPMADPLGVPLTAREAAALDSARHAFFAAPSDAQELQLRRRLAAMLAAEGALGIIGEGEKPFGLLRTYGSPEQPFPLPYLFIAHDSYTQVHRLLRAGERVTLRADVHNTLSRDVVDAHNTVGEIRGSERPDEVVVLAAHMDSWDLGTGATDNAAGVVAVLEAARLLRAAGVRPHRTIRFALFSGEEQGLYGSEAHVALHAQAMSRHQAVLVLDNGTGRITGMSLQGWEAMRPLWDALFSPIRDLGPFTVLSRRKGGSDHRPFIARGVPGFNFDQEPRGYDYTWHSQLDTFDALVPDDVQQAATVMAATAYQLANLPELLPRAPRP
jgi:hypothetical protein